MLLLLRSMLKSLDDPKLQSHYSYPKLTRDAAISELRPLLWSVRAYRNKLIFTFEILNSCRISANDFYRIEISMAHLEFVFTEYFCDSKNNISE